MNPVTFMLDPEDLARLHKLAKDSDTPVSTLVRAIVKSYLTKKGR